MALSFTERSRIMEKPKHAKYSVQEQDFAQMQNYFMAKVIFLKGSGEENRIEGKTACAERVQADTLALPETGKTAVAVLDTKAAAEPDLGRMMDEYGNALLRLCFMYLKDRQLAEDAVQETYIKVFRYYNRFDGSANEKTWVNRIAVNVCKDMLRSAWNRRVSVVEALDEVPDERGLGDKADDTLIKEVMNLKPKYKEVILLYYYQDMKISEIAKALEAPESTISVRLKRARDALEKRLGAWYYGD